MCQRHDAIRNWLAEECRDRCHLHVKLETPWAHAAPIAPAPPAVSFSGPCPEWISAGGSGSAAPPHGRMDLVISINGDDIPVDVSVAS
eukprot:1711947-Prorocentrum_lima.AAC.1